MQRFFINCVNWAMFIIIFIGIPAVTYRQIGHWQISSKPAAEKLMFWGLAIGITFNVLGATLFPFGLKTKESCAKWALILGGLLLLECAFVQGYLNFDWLKKGLVWFQSRF